MKRNLKLLGTLSTAALMTLGITAMTYAAGWDNSTGQWRFLDKNGSVICNEWKADNGNWFYLGSDGVMVKNALIEDNSGSKPRYYFVNKDGAMSRNTWKAVAIDDNNSEDIEAQYWWYYLGADGRAYTSGDKFSASSIKTINGLKYAFDQEGHMLYGWINAETPEQQDYDDTAWQTSTYYFNGWNDGHMQTGWKQIHVTDNDGDDQNYWFYFGTNGKKCGDGRARLKKINGKRYHFAADGHMQDEWLLGSASEWAEPKASGSTLKDVVYLKQDGAERKNRWAWTVPEEKWLAQDYDNDDYSWWYFDNSGNPVNNKIRKINGRKYAFDKYGRMITGIIKVDAGEVTFIDGNDREDTAHLDELSRTEYINLAKSLPDTAEIYYFNDDAYRDGSMRTGYQNINLEDDTYQFYFGRNGKASTGYDAKIRKFTIGGLILKPSRDDDNNYAFIKGVQVENGNYVMSGDISISTNISDAANSIMVNKSGEVMKNKTGIRDMNDQYYVTDKDGVVTDTFADYDSYKNWQKNNRNAK